MNKFKKLILSLTITLLSYAGVEAMGKQITYYDFGKFVNKYTAGQFLSNATVKETGNEGLLQALLSKFDKLPEGSKSLAETLLRSKFKLTSWQLRAKLASIRPAAQIMADAETRIQNLTKENADLQAQIRSLSTETNDLTTNVNRTSPGNIAQLNRLQEQLKNTQDLAARINDRALDLLNDKSRLQKEIDDLRASGAVSAAQIQKMQNQLNIADDALANATQKKANYQNTIKTLNEKVESLTAGLPGGKEAQPIFDVLDGIIKDCNNYYTNQVANKIVINSIDIDKPETGINALNDITTLENIAKDAEAAAKSMEDKVNNYKEKVNAEKDKWNKLNIPKESPLTKELDNKVNSIDQIRNKIDAKVKALRNVKDLANARITEVKEANAKAEAELIKKIKDFANNFPTEEGAKILLEEEKNININEPIDQLKLTLHASTLTGETVKQQLEDFRKLEASAATYPNALAELHKLDANVNLLKQVEAKAQANVQALQAKIQAGTSAGGGPAAGVSGVEVEIGTHTGKLSFNVTEKDESKHQLISDGSDKKSAIQFAKTIANISDPMLEEIGKAILNKIKTGNPKETDTKISEVLNFTLDAPYNKANKATTDENVKNNIQKNIRTIARILLDEFSNQTGLEYKGLKKDFGL